MAHIPLHRETDNVFTEAMTQQIIREAQKHVGEEMGAIRVQAGRERAALKARTCEVRYAFSPQDFGLVPTTTPWLHPLRPDGGCLSSRGGERGRESPESSVSKPQVVEMWTQRHGGRAPLVRLWARQRRGETPRLRQM